MSDTDRPRGVKVYPLPDEANGPRVFGNYALLVRPDDPTTVRVVHTEGVAYKVTDEKPWRWSDHNADLRAWRPIDLVSITVGQNVQPVDLADWVRSFGPRLESNFHQVHWWAIAPSNQI